MLKRTIKKFLPEFLISWYHFILAFLGASIYGFPSRKVKVIGVTGTNGKTTVLNLASNVLEAGGFKVAAFSSIKFKIGDKEKENKMKMTMPGRFTIQKLLREAVNVKCDYCLLEVTSEGIKQFRHKFINFEAAVFTNLSPEHIEAHGGFENYKKAKGKLFQTVKNLHIINAEDKNSEYFLQFPAKKKITYGLERGDVNNQKINLSLMLPGVFNIYNALCAISIGISQGVDLEVCKKAVEGVEKIAGRMEEAVSSPFRVIVDYAFTPNALEQVYETLKNDALKSGGKLIVLLGACGGGRDKWKRPVLGRIAAEHADVIFITNEDPYDEDPMKIIDEVSEGTKGKAVKILDRREAIKAALIRAEPGDVVVMTGKGAEPWIVQSGKKIPWNEKEVVLEEFKKLQK